MTYVGEYKDRLRDGHGSYTFPGQFFHYTGDWCKGKMHGRGIFRMGDGNTYEGEFQDGEIEGIGLRRWPNGSTYNGQFYLGEMHGQGVYLSITGEKYEGQWENNQRAGYGELVFPNNDFYCGKFEKHHPHGAGKIVFASTGESYEGEWKYGKQTGRGILMSSEGSRLYEGQWLDNQRYGEGKGVTGISNRSEGGYDANPLWYQGLWTYDKPKVCTTQLLVKLLQSNTAESSTIRVEGNDQMLHEGIMTDMPPVLTIQQNQLPAIVVLCASFSGETHQDILVREESGRRIRLRIFEGEIPSSMSITDDQQREHEPVTPTRWQLVAVPFINDTASFDPSSVGEKCDTQQELSSTHYENNEAEGKPLREEARLDEVIVETSCGKAVFDHLALPSTTSAGSYYLVFESLATDTISLVYIPLSVLG